MVNSIKEKIEILKRAQQEGWAVGQFNVSNLEVMRAIFQAAQKMKSPVIIGTSEGESKHMGLKQAVDLVTSFEEETGVLAILNLDHAKTFDYIKEAIAAGYDYVHFDGSALPLEDNIRISRDIAEFCREKGVLMEGEVGLIGGSSEILQEDVKTEEKDLTDPEDAKRFIESTKADSLAVSIGNNHGMDASGKSSGLNLKRLKLIKEKIAESAILVLHGGSGIQESDIKEAIKAGITKININTELRLAFTENLKKGIAENKKEVAPHKYMQEASDAVRKIVEDKIRIFGSANKILID
jgi:fructose-bisphosphate aldolase, class II